MPNSITASTTAASTAGAVYDTAASDASLADITGLTSRTTARVDTGAAGHGQIHLTNNHYKFVNKDKTRDKINLTLVLILVKNRLQTR